MRQFTYFLLVASVLLAFFGLSEAALVELNPGNFKKIVEDPKKDVFVMFYATWCGHCHNMMPHWENFAKKHDAVKDNIIIARLDAPTYQEISRQYGVAGFPTLRLFPKGDKSGRLEYNGERNEENFERFLRANTR